MSCECRGVWPVFLVTTSASCSLVPNPTALSQMRFSLCVCAPCHDMPGAPRRGTGAKKQAPCKSQTCRRVCSTISKHQHASECLWLSCPRSDARPFGGCETNARQMLLARLLACRGPIKMLRAISTRAQRGLRKCSARLWPGHRDSFACHVEGTDGRRRRLRAVLLHALALVRF